MDIIKTMDQKQIKLLFNRLKKKNPSPTTELIYSNEFELLISVILSAQATDVSVNKATEKLYKVANTPEMVLKLGLSELKQYIKTIGLYNSKAENIIRTCDILVNSFSGRVPQTRKELESLPGVGRKTANVVLNTAFGHPTIAVDTHIFRVSNRTGLAGGKTPLDVERKLLEVVPKNYKQDAHHWLILHGRYTCTARKPKCDKCCLTDICMYFDKT